MIELAAMSSLCPDWSRQEVVAGLKRHGYTGFEPRIQWDHACNIEVDLPASERVEVRDVFSSEGLRICCIASGARMATPAAKERAAHVEDLHRCIDLAGDLGSDYVRVFGGPRDQEGELSALVDYTAHGFTQVIEQAASRGVTLLMETHDDWCASDEVRSVVDKVSHPNLAVLWDFMHTQRAKEQPQDSFQVLGELTRHTHIHDGTEEGGLKIGALGEGVFDNTTPARMLEDIGYSGFYSVEVICAPGSDHDSDAVLAQHARVFRESVA